MAVCFIFASDHIHVDGCVESTTVGLIERFYDISGGELLIDGHSIKKLDLQELRKTVSIVSQEPNLFDMTIRENICLGIKFGE